MGYFPEAPFTASRRSLELDRTNPQGTIAFTWKSKEGAVFIKKFTFSNESYSLDYDFTITNNSQRPLEGSPVVEWTTAVRKEGDKKKGGFFGGVVNLMWLVSCG